MYNIKNLKEIKRVNQLINSAIKLVEETNNKSINYDAKYLTHLTPAANETEVFVISRTAPVTKRVTYLYMPLEKVLKKSIVYDTLRVKDAIINEDLFLQDLADELNFVKDLTSADDYIAEKLINKFNTLKIDAVNFKNLYILKDSNISLSFILASVNWSQNKELVNLCIDSLEVSPIFEAAPKYLETDFNDIDALVDYIHNILVATKAVANKNY